MAREQVKDEAYNGSAHHVYDYLVILCAFEIEKQPNRTEQTTDSYNNNDDDDYHVLNNSILIFHSSQQIISI